MQYFPERSPLSSCHGFGVMAIQSSKLGKQSVCFQEAGRTAVYSLPHWLENSWHEGYGLMGLAQYLLNSERVKEMCLATRAHSLLRSI